MSAPTLAAGVERGFLTESQLQEQMQEFLGIPYRWGGASARGMDCSGFVNHIYTQLLGVELPHNAARQFRLDIFEDISYDELKPGDLIFFSNSRSRKRIDHVAIYYSDDRFIHASSKRGISFSNLENVYWKPRMVAAKRLVFREDVLASDEAGEYQAEVAFVLTRRNWMSLHYYDRHGLTRRSFAPTDYMLAHGTNDRAQTYFPQAHVVGLEWTHMGRNNAWSLRLSAFRQAYQDDFESHPPSSIWSAGGSRFSNTEDGHDLTGSRGGIELALDFNPRHWLRITPSVTYFGRSDTPIEREAPFHSLGLGAQLGRSTSKWSLAMQMQYSTPASAQAGPTASDAYTAANALDMAIALGYRFNQTLQFALTTEHFLGTAGGVDTPAVRYGLPHSDFRMTMDWRF